LNWKSRRQVESRSGDENGVERCVGWESAGAVAYYNRHVGIAKPGEKFASTLG
jgi:hypothetical protein